MQNPPGVTWPHATRPVRQYLHHELIQMMVGKMLETAIFLFLFTNPVACDLEHATNIVLHNLLDSSHCERKFLCDKLRKGLTGSSSYDIAYGSDISVVKCLSERTKLPFT